MKDFDKKQHWENIYQTKQLTEVSWFQPTPETSLSFLSELKIPHTARIIDVGGGDSFLTDCLLETGYSNISVLDISEKALERAQLRLAEKAGLVKWIVADAAHFEPAETYDFWHDRAAFHFLTSQSDIDNYIATVHKSISTGGYLVLGTFSEQGPTKCSGIEIKQYSEESMAALFSGGFELLKSFTTDHQTPFNTVQNFIFCCFRKR